MMKNDNPKIVLIGELTIDHNTFPIGRYVGAGGSVFFIAKTLENLDQSPILISNYGADFPISVLSKTTFYPDKPQVKKNLIFENMYDNNDSRIQRVKNYKSLPKLNLLMRDQSRELERLQNHVYDYPLAGMTRNAIIVAPLLQSLSENDLKKIPTIWKKSLKILLPQGLYRIIANRGYIISASPKNRENAFGSFDFIILSEKDGKNSQTDYKNWSRLGCVVIVTRAENGCSLYQSENRLDIPAFNVDKIVDATGAGDIFAAGFAYAYLISEDLVHSIYFAHAAAGLSLQFLPNELQYGEREIVEFAKKQGRELKI